MSDIEPTPEEIEASESLVRRALHMFPPGVLWKFVIVGFVGFFTQYFILIYLAHRLAIDPTGWPFWVSVEVGIFITFILNDQWVFKQEYQNSIVMRLLSYEGTLVIGAIFQWLLFRLFYIYLLPGNTFWSNAWAVFFATIWNYIIMRKYIFKGEEDEDSNNGSGRSGKRSGSDSEQKE